MNDRLSLPLATDPRSSLHTSGGFEGLNPEIQAVAGRRLAGIAIVYAGAWVMVFLLFWYIRIVQMGRFVGPIPDYIPQMLVSVAISVALAIAVKRGRVPARHFVKVALAFEFVGAYLTVEGMWGWQTYYAHVLQRIAEVGGEVSLLNSSDVFEVGHVHWLGVWILSFTIIVPIPPVRAAIASFACASLLPAIMGLSLLVEDRPAIVEPWIPTLFWGTVAPPFVVACIASFGAFVVYRLARDLSKARELGSYRLEERIGAGGMGEVWRAHHRLLVRPAAVKLIRPEALGDNQATAVRRFAREAQATAGLRSPHTIDLYDFGIAPDGTFYYVMELLDGLDLRTLVDRFGPVPAVRAVHLLKQASHSLLDAHMHGFIHRDVKPANLFACRRGPDFDFVKVLDFGLVKNTSATADGLSQLTQEGFTSGTPAFMSPEAAMGKIISDPRSDLYSLGCVAYWLITGQLVFDGGSSISILVQHAKDLPIPPSSRTELPVPPSLDRLILACLEKEPENRPGSAREMLEELERMEAECGRWTNREAEHWWQTYVPALGEDGLRVQDRDATIVLAR